MRMRPTFSLALTAALLAGCSETHAREARRTCPPPLLVPYAAIIQRPSHPMPALASAILPASDGDFFVPRGEKSVYGSFSIGDISSYTLYRMDSQLIDDTPGSTSYQYRWVIQQGVAFPPPP
jgi:hypothetical protein